MTQTPASLCKPSFYKAPMTHATFVFAMLSGFTLSLHAGSTEPINSEALVRLEAAFNACRQARQVVATDPITAESLWNEYLLNLRQAESLDSSLLTAPKPVIQDFLDRCGEIGNNLDRVKATNLLQEGFQHCQRSKKALSEKEWGNAERSYQEYVALRDEALGVSSSILEMPTLKQQDEACQQARQNIDSQLAAVSQQQDRIQHTIQNLKKATSLCEQTRTLFNQPDFGQHKLSEASALMATARNMRIEGYQQAESLLSELTDLQQPAAAELKYLMQSGVQCEGRASHLLRQAMQKQSQLVDLLESSNQQLSSATSLCQQALDDETLSEAKMKQLFEQSAHWKQQALADPNILSIAENNPNWTASKTFIQRLKTSRQCQEQLAATLRRQKKARKPAG